MGGCTWWCRGRFWATHVDLHPVFSAVLTAVARIAAHSSAVIVGDLNYLSVTLMMGPCGAGAAPWLPSATAARVEGARAKVTRGALLCISKLHCVLPLAQLRATSCGIRMIARRRGRTRHRRLLGRRDRSPGTGADNGAVARGAEVSACTWSVAEAASWGK